MKNLTLICLLLISTQTITACKKKIISGKTDLTVFMYDMRTGEGIDGAQYEIFQSRGSYTELSGSEIKEITEGSLENGKADINFKSKRLSNWVTIMRFPFLTEVYFYEGDYFEFVIDKFEKNHIEIPVLPMCDVTYHFKNTACTSESNSMIYKRRHTLIDAEFGRWNPIPFTGCFDQISGPVQFPAGDYEILMEVTKDGITDVIPFSYTVHEDVNNIVELFY